MVQIELYVTDIDHNAQLFTSVFDFKIVQEKLGFKSLQDQNKFDLMLFNPEENLEGESHWQQIPKQRGVGVEIVILVQNILEKQQKIRHLGYECSELKKKPWGSIEFTFFLNDGYLIRVKQK